MIADSNNVSVIITTYRRLDSIAKVVTAWLAQPVRHVWVVDGSGGKALDRIGPISADPRFEYWPLWKDHGTRTDYALAHLTDGDHVILADDDLVPLEGFVDELMAGMHDTKADIAGVMGRTFHGKSYYGQSRHYRADNVLHPIRVGFCGVAFVARRELFGFDTRGMTRNVDDLWFQMKEHPSASKWVVPTKAYRDLPCSRTGMFHDRGKLRKQREEFYAKYYSRNYADQGGLEW